MAKAPKLKVFRTAIGFHDAYIAAPSQKAALAAWGSEHDLFARGVAERVDDPALTKEALARPGVVIRKLRGTAAEHLAALPKTRAKTRSPSSTDDGEPPRKRKATVRKPDKAAAKPPNRRALDAANDAVAAAESRQRAEDKALRDRETAIARERRDLDQAHARETRRLEQKRDEAATAYDRAMRDWRG